MFERPVQLRDGRRTDGRSLIHGALAGVNIPEAGPEAGDTEHLGRLSIRERPSGLSPSMPPELESLLRRDSITA
jgi:hypothetical protein